MREKENDCNTLRNRSRCLYYQHYRGCGLGWTEVLVGFQRQDLEIYNVNVISWLQMYDQERALET